MNTTIQRFAALKQKVGGNREKMQFEFTFGPQPEEKAHVTRPSASIIRVMSELNFALNLSRVNENKFDEYIEKALDILESIMESEGVLTNTACAEAEEALLPLSKAAKEYEVIYAAHAHIDMNWMWGLQETVASTLATFRTMLQMMEEYPQFTFMQSQGAVYKIVEKYDPQMMEAIKQRIKEGRWEITASAWVETDKNMPDTESLLRHISVTKDYLQRVWDVDPDTIKVDFSPDTFGHSRFMPEINNSFKGIKYYYHCRGLKEIETLYKYRGPSGTEVMMYREPYWYNSGVNPDNGTGIIGLSERTAGLKTGLVVYGVGDHGGGPTRRDVERIIEMAKWPVFPTMKFGTLHEFFDKAEKAVYDKVNVVEHELNAIFMGCYTTQSRIKLGNRRSEVAIMDAEKMCALGAQLLNIEYPKTRFDEAWQDVLFTHFHDILTGSCVQETREHAMGMFAEALSYAQSAQSNALRVISEAVDTSAFITGEDISDTQAEGAGAGFGLSSYAGVPNPERGAGKTRPYTVFNTASSPREDIVTITLWDYTGDLRRIEVVDDKGSALPFELLDKEYAWYWDHRFVRVLVKVSVPGNGYMTMAIREKPVMDYPTYYLDDERIEKIHAPVVLENDYIYAKFNLGSGALTSLIDKQTGKEQLWGPARLECIIAEKRTNSAWKIGRHLKSIPIDDTLEIKPNKGDIRQSVEISQKFRASKMKTIVSLDKDAKELAFAFEIDWNEASFDADSVPVLIYRMPIAGGADKILSDVPAGAMLRDADYGDVAGLTYSAAIGKDIAPALITDCKYGYRLVDNMLSVTLINTSSGPDPYPERGIHKIQMWIAPSDGDAVKLKRRAEALMRPLIAMPTKAKQGELPPVQSFMSFESDNCILSAVEMNPDKSLKLRLFEMKGEKGKADITLNFKPKSVNCAGAGKAKIKGDAVQLELKPYTFVEIEIG